MPVSAAIVAALCTLFLASLRSHVTCQSRIADLTMLACPQTALPLSLSLSEQCCSVCRACCSRCLPHELKRFDLIHTRRRSRYCCIHAKESSMQPTSKA